jgi:hypothetical protein
VNWGYQNNVWDYIFINECCPVNYIETPLIFTEPYFYFLSVQEVMVDL